MNRHDDKIHYVRGVLLIIASSFLWALVETLGYFIPGTNSPYQTILVRYGAHLLFMVVVLGPRYKGGLVRTNRLPLQIFRSMLMVGMPFFYITAVLGYHMPLKDLHAIFWLSPLLVMGLGALILRERTGWTRWLLATIAFVGVLIVLHPDRGALSFQGLLAFGMAFCFSLYRVLTRALRTESTIANLFYTAFGVFVVLLVLAPTFWTELKPEHLVPMVAIGLLGYLALYLVDKAYESAPVSLLAPFIYIEPLIAVVLNFMFLHELPVGSLIIGVPIVLLAGVYLFFTDNRAQHQQNLQPIPAGD